MNLNELPDPCKDLNRWRDRIQMSASVSKSDIAFIRAVCPSYGIITRLTQCFFAELVLELKEAGITHYSHDNIIKFTDRTKSRFTRCAAVELARAGLQQHDAGAAAGVHGEASRGCVKHTDLEEYAGRSEEEVDGRLKGADF